MYSVDVVGTKIVALAAKLTGPNNIAFTASSTTTVASRVFGPANAPFSVKLPRLINAVLAAPFTLISIFPFAAGMAILVLPLVIEVALMPDKNLPLPQM